MLRELMPDHTAAREVWLDLHVLSDLNERAEALLKEEAREGSVS